MLPIFSLQKHSAVRKRFIALLLPFLLFLGLLVAAHPGLAQSPLPTPPPPTQPPAIMIIQPTATPAPTPQGSLLRQVWEEKQKEIILTVITTILTGILIGVFLRRIADTLADWASRFFHFLFDRFASAPLLRWRYDSAYRKALASRVQVLASSNIVDREMRLDEVYVPVSLTEETQAGTGAAFEDLIQWDQDRRRRQRDRAVEPWEAVHRFPCMVVMGEPGAGKTTYLSHLAFLCARRERLPTHTPVFVRLHDLVAFGRLEDALPQLFADLDFPNAERFIKSRLTAGRCLLLLDGLDEVETSDQHQHLIELVQEFADRVVQDGPKDETPGNVVVVSTRTHSYQHSTQLRGFTKTEVMDFDDPTIERFVNKWFDPQHLRPLAPRLLATLAENRRFKELARNPLLLLLIVDHYEREQWLPKGRADLYDCCIETRITRWNERRGTHRGSFGKTDKRRMLRELALYLFQTEHRGLLLEDSLYDWLRTFISDNHIQVVQDGQEMHFRPEDFLTEIIEGSGLIRERALRRYGFSHLTLQEYFTAEGAVRLGATAGAELLNDHLTDPRAQEIVLLYCGLADDARPLLEKIVLRAQGGNDALWLLAGRCLVEKPPKVTDETYQASADELLALVRQAEAGVETALTAEESNEALRLLSVVAPPAALPGYARALLDTGASHDALLAARLLPEDADPELRAEISRRLESLTHSGEVTERRAAAVALGQVATASADTLQALWTSLESGDPDTRAESARALGRLGAKDETTLTTLLRLYPGDPADAVRHAALQALLALGQAEKLGLILVPAGRFWMGCDDGHDDEKPRHEVYLPDFYVARAPVTNAAYARFVAAAGHNPPQHWKGQTPPQEIADHPVVDVSWRDAVAYARWAGLRLPSEAEWEKAASWDPAAGRKREYPWGDEFDKDKCNTSESDIGGTTPVGRYSPGGDSPYGCVDMAGNVWEWTSSLYKGYPYQADDGREDLSSSHSRVVRGGAFFDGQWDARCAYRLHVDPDLLSWYCGFRVVAAPFSHLSGL